jgi:hypothetical protein
MRHITTVKSTLVAILKADAFLGDKLDAADKAFLTRWADNCADDPIWEQIVADARAYGLWPQDSIHSAIIWYALDARRIAAGVKAGNDPLFEDKQKRRTELLALAAKADDLAWFYQEQDKYSGVAMFFQRFMALPVMPEQDVVPRVEPPFLRVQQLRALHEREAKLLRQLAGREPKPTTFISRKKSKRSVTAFIHLMGKYMEELCRKQHRHAIAILANIAFNFDVDDEDVRKALITSTRKDRSRKIRAFDTQKS